MVRHKNRWLLVHLHLEEDNDNHNHKLVKSKTNGNHDSVTALDIYQTIRESISVSFGIVGMSETSDTRGMPTNQYILLVMILSYMWNLMLRSIMTTLNSH